MSLARRLFPRPRDSKRRRQFQTIQIAVTLGLGCAAVVGTFLYLLYSLRKL